MNQIYLNYAEIQFQYKVLMFYMHFPYGNNTINI